jgi:hypothetical protein
MLISPRSRYYGLATLEIEGRVGLEQRLQPPAEPRRGSIIHVIVGNERLDELARRYYGREDLWWRIADANPNVFALDWKAGDELLIPPPGSATRTRR